ncbi:Gag-polypeptide of LTR copia-type [Sesbania bispinosa]|nr:Gag-polypeptide of LTR copia-type [Sesbania bispinosa]
MTNPSTPTAPSTSPMHSLVHVSVKLDEDNFLVWKMQATGTIKSFKLQKFIDLDLDGGRPLQYKSIIGMDFNLSISHGCR